jgi:serine/threonine protein kinase
MRSNYFIFIFRVKFPKDRYISDGLYDLFSKLFEKDPFKRITTQELKCHPWLNYNRTPLTEYKSERLHISEEELHHSLKFFSNIQIAVN